jgi:hypothetical protein
VTRSPDWRTIVSDRFTPDNEFIEDGGETYEDLANLSPEDDE